jgi:SAM-dependent methyltransferase
MPKIHGYRADLAFIHDVGFSDLALAAAPGILEQLRSRGLGGGLVVDLGCGGGRLARRLHEAGHEVLGIDQSPAMIARARTNAPGCRFRVGSFLDSPLPDCVAVVSTGECLNYRLDRRLGTSALRRLARRVHAAVRPGGLFLFDILEPGVLGPSKIRQAGREGDDWAVMAESRESARRLVRRITAFRRVGGCWRRSREEHVVELRPRAEWLEILRGAGFRARTAPGYGAFRLGRGHRLYIAVKP